MAIKKVRIRPEGGNNYADIIHPETSADVVIESENKMFVSSAEKTNWNDANSKKHTHNNKSIIDTITQTLIDKWNSAWEHISDSVKHITSAERAKWNTVSNKADTSYVNTELNKKSDKGHTHTEANILDLDKYTKAETDAKLSLKQDKLGYTPVNKAGDTMTGDLKVNGNIVAGTEYIIGYEGTSESLQRFKFKYNASTGYLELLRYSTDTGWTLCATFPHRNHGGGGLTIEGKQVAYKSDIPTKLSEFTKDINFDERYYTESEVNNKLNNKVDKVSGKGLSTEDYTTAEKNKLSGIEAGANKYTHPSTHPASMITQDSTHRFTTDTEKNNWNSAVSHISDTIKHITSAERTLWDTVTTKSNIGHTHDDRYYTEDEINSKLKSKSDTGHTHTKSDITDFPTSLPANGGNADTVDGYHAHNFVKNYIGRIPNTYTFNTALTQGEYEVSGEIGGQNGAPLSGTLYGKLIVIVSDGLTHNNASNWIWQIFHNTSNLRTYKRQKVNNASWSSWSHVGDYCNADTLDGYHASAFAPANHASKGTEYGIATAGNYGHARVWDGLDESNRLPGVALSAYQGKVLKDLIDSSKIEVIESTSSGTWNLGLAKWAIVTTNLPSVYVNGVLAINTNDNSSKFVMIQDIGGRVYATGLARHQGSTSATSLNSINESRYSSSNYIRISSSDSGVIRIMYGY